MITLTRTHRIVITGLGIAFLLLCGFVYERFLSDGFFSKLENDLKTIQATEDVRYTDMDGNRVDIATFTGKPLIINSWATWIPFSKDELKLLESAKQKYGDAITILAINRKEDIPRIKSYISLFNISGDVVLLADETDNFYTVIQGYATPETIFYNPDGTIHMHKRGVLTEIELHGGIETLISSQ